jgi:hypothetical protein
MKIRSLQTKGIFCCCCQIANGAIECELVATNGKQDEISSLLDPDSGNRYAVNLMPGANVFWNRRLEVVTISKQTN